MLKKIALVVALICSVASAQQTANTTLTAPLEPGQVYSTGNLVNWTAPNTTAPTTSTTSPWINGVYTNILCFYGGDPGNCGPNPTVRPGSINFSYGTTDIYQVTSVAAALPNSGTGLNVNGYNFSFMAKNGNGWDDGRQDYLTAYVRFYGSNGSTVRDDFYNLNYKFDWTYFNYSKTFDTPYASKDLTAAQYGFVGRDNNFWAGNYGPEVTNISFSLKYSVDPCATNPMFSPTCPGYLDALAKLVPVVTTSVVADPVTTTATAPVASTTIVTDPVASTVNVTSTTTVGQPSVVSPVVSAPASTISTSPTSSSTTSATASTSTTKESSGSTSNTSLALSIISKNNERDAAGSAVAQSAVAQAQQAASQAQQEAASVASSATANSLTQNAVGSSSQQSSGNGIRVSNANSTNFTLQSGVTSSATVIGLGLSTNNILVQQQASTPMSTNMFSNQPVANINNGSQQSSNNSTTSFVLPLLQPQQPSIVTSNNTSVTQSEQPQSQTIPNSTVINQTTETISMLPSNFLTDKSNPLTDIIEAKQNIPQSNTSTFNGPSVNRNASDNEVAGGVDINKMAMAPTGYGDYLNFTLRDSMFYAPKEVYKNQRNVDNARALRQLTNDSKHKDMVEMQYAR